MKNRNISASSLIGKNKKIVSVHVQNETDTKEIAFPKMTSLPNQ